MARSKKNEPTKIEVNAVSEQQDEEVFPVEQERIEGESIGNQTEENERVVELEQSLAECQSKANEYLDGWQRARAEFANYKKRIEREQAQVYQTAAGSILKRQLEVLDDLDRALANRPAAGDGAGWAEGIELVYRKLMNILENEGVMVMDVEGKMFDPNLHEAISSEDNPDFDSGQVIAVLQKGYLLGDRVLRPALVRVAR
jgi:molecular chaperone GrpE